MDNENLKNFIRELLVLAKKYDIQDIHSCGCCDGALLSDTKNEVSFCSLDNLKQFIDCPNKDV